VGVYIVFSGSMTLKEQFISMPVSQKIAVAALALTSAVTWGSVIYNFSGIDPLVKNFAKAMITPTGASYRPEQQRVTAQQDIDVDVFMQGMLAKSQEGLSVVMVASQGCLECISVSEALREARYDRRKIPFSFYIIDPKQNPEIAARVGYQDEERPRLHVYYGGEKIHLSAGVTDRADHIVDYLEGAYRLAIGEASHLDRYHAPRAEFKP
jgi:hypothetical protein